VRAVIRACALSLALSVMAPMRAYPQPVPLGDELIVNSYTTGFQGEPSVASDGAGSFVVVWTGAGSTRGQRFDADGLPLGTELEVTVSNGDIGAPRVAMDAGGAFVVTWLNFAPEIDARAYDADGQPRGDVFRVDSTIFDYYHGYHSGGGDEKGPPDVTPASDGNFFVVWAGGYNEYLYFRHRHRGMRGALIDAAGSVTGPDFDVGGSSYYYARDPAIAGNAQGQFVVAWTQLTDYTYDYSGPDLMRSPNYGVRARRLANNGGSQSDRTDVAPGEGVDLDVAVDGAANFIVQWGGSARRYDGDGQPLGSEFQVKSPAFAGGTYEVQVAAAEGGSFAVVWSSGINDEDHGDGSGSGIFARTFASDGSPLGSEIAVNTYTTGAQTHPVVAFTDPDDFVVAWQSDGQDGSDWTVAARRFARAPACGDASADGKTTATDALIALATAVAAGSCPPCVCDGDASGDITATDALRILRVAVGQQATLGCNPC
jgi:hypothetical protein